MAWTKQGAVVKENHDSHTGLQDFISLGLQQAVNDIILKHETYKDYLSIIIFLFYLLFVFNAYQNCQFCILGNRNMLLVL